MKIDLLEYTQISGDKYIEAYVKVRCNDKLNCTLKVLRNKDGNLVAFIPSVKIHDKWVKCFDFEDKALTSELEKACTEMAHREHPKSRSAPSIHDYNSDQSLPF